MNPTPYSPQEDDKDTSHELDPLFKPISKHVPFKGIFGDYEILKPIAEGGMGTVYLASNPKFDGPVALKVLKNKSPQLQQRFLREAQIIAKLRHPNIIQILDYGMVDQESYLAMPYLHGQDLKAVIEQKAPLEINLALPWMIKICAAVEYAHLMGVIHRDLKPANIFVLENGTPILMDFGVAREEDSMHLTQTGQTLGSPMYMSPEQMKNSKEIDARTDIYSLGVILFEMLSGKRPFGGDKFELFYQVMYEKPLSLKKIIPSLPSEVDKICQKALQKDVEKRFASPGEMSKTIQEFLQSGGEKKKSASLSTRKNLATPPARKKTGMLLFAAILFLFLTTGTFFFIYSSRGKENKKKEYEQCKTRAEKAYKEKEFGAAEKYMEKALSFSHSTEDTLFFHQIKARRHLQEGGKMEKEGNFFQAFLHYYWASVYGKEKDLLLQAETKKRELRFSWGKVYDTAPSLYFRKFGGVSFLKNGKILIAGGCDEKNVVLSSAEIYDPIAGKFEPTGSMKEPRLFHCQTVLPDGKILLSGGISHSQPFSMAKNLEIYDPEKGEFFLVGSMHFPRFYHTSTLLSSGLVLLCGGFSEKVDSFKRIQNLISNSAEIYNPSSQRTILTAGNMREMRHLHSAVPQRNGGVLIFSGAKNNEEIAISVELFDPQTLSFSSLPMEWKKMESSFCLLPGGDCIIAGGRDAQGKVLFSQIERYSSSEKSFRICGNLKYEKKSHNSLLLENGVVLILSGKDNQAHDVPSIEIYDPKEGNFLPQPFQKVAGNICALLLADGRILVLSKKSENKILDFSHPDLQNLAPQIASINGESSSPVKLKTGISFQIQGKNFQGPLEGQGKGPFTPQIFLSSLSNDTGPTRQNFNNMSFVFPVEESTSSTLRFLLPDSFEGPPGLYILRIESGDLVSPGKIVKILKSEEIPGFIFTGLRTYSCNNITNQMREYRHLASGMEFLLIPGKGEMKPFLMSKYEVTQGLWKRVMGSKNFPMQILLQDRRTPFHADTPIFFVIYSEAKDFCKRTGLSLPTSAQWKHAYWGGSKTRYFWGDSMDARYFWGIQNLQAAGRLFAQPVGQKLPNPYGLYDIAGNVWEWTEDEEMLGGSWAEESEESYRLINYLPSKYTRSEPGKRCNNFGFRVVKNFPENPIKED